MPIDFTDSAVRLRQMILDSLVELASSNRPKDAESEYRARAESLVVELSKADRTIALLTPRTSYPYAGCEEAIDAVMEYLADTKRPQTEKQIRDGCLAGGWRGAKEGAELRLHKAIEMHLKASRGELKNAGKMVGKIKEIGGLIGLHEWDETRFRPLS
jgi:hypothetical protein